MEPEFIVGAGVAEEEIPLAVTTLMGVEESCVDLLEDEAVIAEILKLDGETDTNRSPPQTDFRTPSPKLDSGVN